MRMSHCKECGFTLLEVMIAVLILAIALLGHSRLQLLGLRGNTNAYHQTQAAILAQDLAERIRANKKAVEDGDFGSVSLNVTDCSKPPNGCFERRGGATANCTAKQLAEDDVWQWGCMAKSLIPDLKADLAQNKDEFVLTLIWSRTELDGGTTDAEFSLRFRP